MSMLPVEEIGEVVESSCLWQAETKDGVSMAGFFFMLSPTVPAHFLHYGSYAFNKKEKG